MNEIVCQHLLGVAQIAPRLQSNTWVLIQHSLSRQRESVATQRVSALGVLPTKTQQNLHLLLSLTVTRYGLIMQTGAPNWLVKSSKRLPVQAQDTRIVHEPAIREHLKESHARLAPIEGTTTIDTCITNSTKPGKSLQFCVDCMRINLVRRYRENATERESQNSSEGLAFLDFINKIKGGYESKSLQNNYA